MCRVRKCFASGNNQSHASRWGELANIRTWLDRHRQGAELPRATPAGGLQYPQRHPHPSSCRSERSSSRSLLPRRRRRRSSAHSRIPKESIVLGRTCNAWNGVELGRELVHSTRKDSSREATDRERPHLGHGANSCWIVMVGAGEMPTGVTDASGLLPARDGRRAARWH